MKRIMAVLCALLLIASAAAACADGIVKPNTSETLKALVAGKQFEADVTGYEFTGEDEDTKFKITIAVCEYDQFDAAVVEKLTDRDILAFSNGTFAMVKEAVADEFGVEVTGYDDETYIFTRTEAGTYIASKETGYPLVAQVFTVTVPLEKDIVFLDWSDPESTEPTKLGFDQLLTLLQEDTNFSSYNTRVTFDENGKLVEFLYTYSPFN